VVESEELLIERLMDTIVRPVPASVGDNLTGFVMDADHFFGDCPAFSEARVERGSAATSLVNISLTLSDFPQSLQDVSRALEETWRSIAYAHFQASSVIWFRIGARRRGNLTRGLDGPRAVAVASGVSAPPQRAVLAAASRGVEPRGDGCERERRKSSVGRSIVAEPPCHPWPTHSLSGRAALAA
jgi:hypothetical protein